MITVYVLAYNEEFFIPHMIKHYRERFPICHIVIYDNMSTDKTVEIAVSYNCEVIPYDTGNTIQDSKYLEIKNNCWKNASTNWVLICDMDELLEIDSTQLLMEENSGNTIISTEGYNMVDVDDVFNDDITDIKYGARSISYDKSCLFDKRYIKEINYRPGCHECSPVGEKLIYSESYYKLYHYHAINLYMLTEKFRRNRDRLSQENVKNGWGIHYSYTDEEIKNYYDSLCKGAVIIR